MPGQNGRGRAPQRAPRSSSSATRWPPCAASAAARCCSKKGARRRTARSRACSPAISRSIARACESARNCRAGEADAPARATAVHTFSFDGGLPPRVFASANPGAFASNSSAVARCRTSSPALDCATSSHCPLATWWSAPRDLAPGNYSVEFDCDLPLAATELNFAVGLTSDEKSIYYAEGAGASPSAKRPSARSRTGPAAAASSLPPRARRFNRSPRSAAKAKPARQRKRAVPPR